MPEIPAVHCEAKKVAYRQTKDGLVVSFVIHPNDMPDALAVAPLGQRYMLAMAAIGDDEQPVDETAVSGSKTTPNAAETLGDSYVDENRISAASQRGKERYLEATAQQQALIRAACLPKDDKFREWIAAGWGVSMVAEETAADYIRDSCCGGGSRKLIAEDPACYQAFLALETEYKLATGQMAEVR